MKTTADGLWVTWLTAHKLNMFAQKSADTFVFYSENVSDDVAVFLSDILPTGHEIKVQYGGVKVGDTIVIVGAYR